MMMAVMTLKSVVLLTAVLILTYGLYVPKSWRRAAVVVGPLALLQFAPLPVLALRHPAAMAWLGKAWGSSTTPAALLFTYDWLILIILAVSATFGASALEGLIPADRVKVLPKLSHIALAHHPEVYAALRSICEETS